MNVFTRHFLFVSAIFLACSLHLQAQIRDTISAIGSTKDDTIPQGLLPLETDVPRTYVLMQNERKVYTVADTFTWADNRLNPLSDGFSDLGNIASASRSLWRTDPVHSGFYTGWSQYDSTLLSGEQFRFYNQSIPAGKVKYSQANKDNTNISLDFGRRFAKGISFSIAYQRFNQRGNFNHQQQRNTSLGLGLWHDAPDGHYDAFYLYLSSSAFTQENGGITDTSFIVQDLFPDENVPVNLTSGLTKHKHRSFATRQVYHVTSDTTDLGLDLWYKAKFETGIYSYADPDAKDAPAYYGSFYLEERGIRQYTYTDEFDQALGFSVPWKAAHSFIEGALRYRKVNLNQEPLTRRIHEFFFEALGDFQWIDPLELHGELSLGLGQATGEYRFKAGAKIHLGVLGKLSGTWTSSSRLPYMIEERLFVNQLPVYDKDWKNPFTSEFDVSWDLAKLDFNAGIRWTILDNYIWFDSLSMPNQTSGTFSVRQLRLRKGFDFRWIGLNAMWVWQPNVKKELAWPATSITASIYGRIPLFKRIVILMPGIDYTYYSSYPAVHYFPVNGVFAQNETGSLPALSKIDIGLSLHIRFIKAFFRFEDLVGAWKNRVFYQSTVYPYYRGYFRFGIEAGFFN